MFEYKDLSDEDLKKETVKVMQQLFPASKADIVGICCNYIAEKTDKWLEEKEIKRIGEKSHDLFVLSILAREIDLMHEAEANSTVQQSELN
jgi:hypothetical protein